jgi:tetratricopeptide (TPR) repeat protein
MHSTQSRISIGAAVIIVLLIRGTTVDAQPTPASPDSASEDQRAEARQLTDEAIAAQAAQNYDLAIDRYKKAYQLVPHPVLLFNIGQTNRLAGNLVQAELFYRRYLERDPEGPYAPMARELIASTTQDASAAPQEISASRAAMLRYASYTLIGFGVLLGASGIRIIYQDQVDVGLAMGCISVGLISTGVVTYMYSKRQRQRRPAKSVSWSPVIGTGFAGFTLAGTLP